MLVKTTFSPPAGATWLSRRVPVSCNSLPMEMPPVMPIPGVNTVAATVPFCGAEKPAGTPALSVVLPGAAGWNWATALENPPVIVTGDVVMVPILGFELVIFTLTGLPPAMACTATMFIEVSRTADITLIAVGIAPVVVKKLRDPGPNGPETKNPEGARVTVPVAMPNPAALAEYVAVPLLASPYT